MRHSAQGNFAPRRETTVELSVDQNNTIVRVNTAWDDFAASNDGAHLANDAVLGCNLLDAISGKISKNFTLTLLDMARKQTQAVIFDYRCDSPQVRRFMRAHLSSDSSAAVHYRHEHLYSEPFTYPVSFKTATQRGRDTLIRCSICNHVRHDGLWKVPEFVSQQMLDTQVLPVIYGVCPSCLELLGESR
jgi:hypothetical protein